MDLSGNTILITGASAGIGAGFAREFHRMGNRVVLVARRAERLEELAAELNALRPDSAEYLVIDLTNTRSDDPQGLPQLLNYISSNRIDVMVNNAGRGSFGYFDTLEVEQEQELIALNIGATLSLAHAVIPQMKARRSGAIITVSSIAGFQPLPYMATYSATKAFNFNHSLALWRELSEFEVRVLTVCPGPVGTEFSGVARMPGKPTGIGRDKVDGVVRDSIMALKRNRPFVVPCWQGKLLSIVPRLFPISFSTWLTGKLLRSSLP